jgi:hypothetical protein
MSFMLVAFIRWPSNTCLKAKGDKQGTCQGSKGIDVIGLPIDNDERQ